MHFLFDELSQKRNAIRVEEVWAVECPNHGASALLNKEALQLAEFRRQCELDTYLNRYLVMRKFDNPFSFL